MATLTSACLNSLSYLNWHTPLSLTDTKNTVSEHMLAKTSKCLSVSVTLKILYPAKDLVSPGNNQILVSKGLVLKN